MRTLPLAALLFAAGFAAVSIGQHAAAFFGHSRISQNMREQAQPTPAVTPPPLPQKPPAKTFSDYVTSANRAFAAMDRSCSAFDREVLGQAFQNLIDATDDLHAGLIGPGALDPATALKLVNAKPGMALAQAARSPDLIIFAQVIDASRRGILTAGDFPNGSAKLMHFQLKMVRRKGEKTDTSLNTDIRELANRVQTDRGSAGFRKTRCPPV